MSENYTIISADGHAGADHATYRSYLESSWHDEFDAWRGKYANPFRDLQDDGKTRNWDSERRLADMHAEGIVAEVIFPNTVPPFFPTGALITPPPNERNYQRRLAGIRAHNRWLVDWCAEHPERRAGIAQIFLNDVDDAIEDITFAAENNLRGGVLLPGVPDTSELAPLYSPEYDRIWAAAQDMDVVVNHHSGGGSPDYGKHAAAGVMFLVETTFFSKRAVHQLIMSGVFERFPGIKFVITEQGFGWIPELFKRLDFYHGQMAGGRVGELGFPAEVVLPHKPSDYFNRNITVGASFPGPNEASVLDEVGVDNIMWGSDYPHNEASSPYSKEAIRYAFHDRSEAELRKMLSQTAAEIYNFDLDALAPFAAEHGPSVEELAQPLTEIPADATSPAFFTK